jgi:hypothetical protein
VRVVDADGELAVAEELRARRRVDRWRATPDAPSWNELFGPPREVQASTIGLERLDLAPDLEEVFPR